MQKYDGLKVMKFGCEVIGSGVTRSYRLPFGSSGTLIRDKAVLS